MLRPKQLFGFVSIWVRREREEGGEETLQARYVDHCVVCGEVVQDVAFCFVAKG